MKRAASLCLNGFFHRENSSGNSQLPVHSLYLGETVVDLLIDCGDFLPVLFRENAHFGQHPCVVLDLRTQLHLVLQALDEQVLRRLAFLHRLFVVGLRARRLGRFGRRAVLFNLLQSLELLVDSFDLPPISY